MQVIRETMLKSATDRARLEEIEAAFLRGEDSLLGSRQTNSLLSLTDIGPYAGHPAEGAGSAEMARTVRTTSRRCC